MKVTKKINLDLVSGQSATVVYATQNDYSTRKIEAHLFCEGSPWNIPENTECSVSYKKPDGTTGWYDKLEDGSSAVSYSGNVVTVSLAAQSLTVSGDVFVSIVFNEPSTLKQLASFPFVVKVSDFPSGSGQISNNFYKYDTIGELNDALVSLEKNVSKMKEAFYIHVTKNDGVYYASETYDKISEAINWYYTRKERPVFCILWDNAPSDFIILPLTAFDIYEGDVIFTKIQYNYEVVVTIKKDAVEVGKVYIPYKHEIPEALPNPEPLSIDGVSYDGSEAVSVESYYTLYMERVGDGWMTQGSDEGIAKAHGAGKPVYCWCFGRKLPLVDAEGNYGTSYWKFVFAAVVDGMLYQVTRGNDGVSATYKELANKEDIPETLPNPQPLSINGKVYDGSKEVTILDAPLVVHVGGNDDDGYGMDVSLDVIDSAYRTGRRLWCQLGSGVILPLVTTYGGGIEYGYTFSGVDGGSVWKINVGTNGIKVISSPVAFKTDLPTALPNPHALTVNGVAYDGSEPVEVALEGGGADGETPYIGDNGNWWIGEEDTGVKAAGEDGEQGPQGETGPAGYSPVRGTDYWTEADKAEVVEEAVAAVSSSGSLPDYWTAYLPDRISAIQALQDEGGKDSFGFIVIADPHHAQMLAHYSPKIAKYIQDQCDIRYVLALGDFQNRGSWCTKEEADAEWAAIQELFAPLTELRALGNHDGSWGATLDGVTYPYNYTPAELYNRVLAKTYRHHNVVTDSTGTAYYVDDTTRKVRFIVLNTSCNEYGLNENGSAKYSNMGHFRFTQAQYDFLTNVALTQGLNDGWSVVVAAHVPISNTYAPAFGGDNSAGDHIIMRNLLTAYKNKTAYNAEWAGTAGGGTIGGYTNLFNTSGSGYEAWNGSKMYTNWIPYSKFVEATGDSALYHFKGWVGDTSPYKYQLACDENGTDPSILSYTTGSGSPAQQVLTVSNYDSSVKTFHPQNVPLYTHIRFEFREDIAANLIITANEDIVEAVESEVGYDGVSVNADFSAAKGDLVGYFCGHAHNDCLWNASNGWGIDIISTRCDSANENDSTLLAERIAGTVTEHCFDVFIVNKNTRTVSAIRIGAGEDRTINY